MWSTWEVRQSERYLTLFSLVAINEEVVGLHKHWGAERAEVIENILNCCTFLSQSDCPYSEKVPSIKIPMDIMEQQPFLSDNKPLDSE